MALPRSVRYDWVNRQVCLLLLMQPLLHVWFVFHIYPSEWAWKQQNHQSRLFLVTDFSFLRGFYVLLIRLRGFATRKMKFSEWSDNGWQLSSTQWCSTVSTLSWINLATFWAQSFGCMLEYFHIIAGSTFTELKAHLKQHLTSRWDAPAKKCTAKENCCCTKKEY